MLSQQTIEIVKSTAPVLAEHGQHITKRFYEMLFTNHPELLNIFNHMNQREGRQSAALANAVYAAAVNIDRLETIIPVVKQIGHKHRALNVKPEHYPIVGNYLLLAIKDVLGEAATDDIIAAWGEAYGVIANAFISVEEDMYTEAKQQAGGWEGFRRFIVDRKVKESDVITSFYLQAEDGGAIAAFEPGQYLTVRVQPAGHPNTHLRHYSLSDASGKDMYRISVKREAGIITNDSSAAQGTGTEVGDSGMPTHGVVSCYLHDAVQVGDVLEASAPAGEFTLQQGIDTPVVLLSGGVGATPLVSMLHTLVSQEPARQVHYVHAARNGSAHAFREEVGNVAALQRQVQSFVCYDHPESDDNCDHQGFIDATWLQAVIPSDVWSSADVYFCGPVPFMRAMYRVLKQLGVSTDRIHYEFFGPASAIEEV
ncbi:NO-inducible flavohemoprotein [Paenibacillus sp. 481]|uniref:NO-inducible flavohemoprotein n=1 Tax=Paenibacillus sp. 481 TaxID=2835869 RepID=UPI001E65BE58|nr:NO-inducible flavohemoprotein [Paenibacillus sp. 481]UHA73994.1 NO-inducible flavohemoprotein [Paenibacillus sp. 481]